MDRDHGFVVQSELVAQKSDTAFVDEKSWAGQLAVVEE